MKRIINRVTQITETNDSIVTRVTERVVEEDHGHAPMIVGVVGPAESNQSEFQVVCNICTCQFNYDNSGKCRCPSCGSRSVSIA